MEEAGDENTPHADCMAAARASGVFDAVREEINRRSSPHHSALFQVLLTSPPASLSAFDYAPSGTGPASPSKTSRRRLMLSMRTHLSRAPHQPDHGRIQCATQALTPRSPLIAAPRAFKTQDHLMSRRPATTISICWNRAPPLFKMTASEWVVRDWEAALSWTGDHKDLTAQIVGFMPGIIEPGAPKPTREEGRPI